MTDRPIIFSAPMIRALIDGRKTQTRRIIKKKPALDAIAVFGADFLLKPGCADLIPYAHGDLLWVRENLYQACRYPCTLPSGEPEPSSWTRGRLVHYAADGKPENTPNRHYPKGLSGKYISAPDPYATWELRPSIHMPRWASRITLEVTGVKVERLQNISRGDAMAEGCPFPNISGGPDPRDWFQNLWRNINGPESWDQNPFVAAISFKVHKRNIDKLGAE
ncbi:MAG: hypothetical protein HQL44_17105 [Alphaproteobacteria bacterium]|nr:hypothetical protein [Alphaproteobacteria bacterium]